MTHQYARVPIELVELVDAPALQLYVQLCKYARRGGYCYPSNPELSERTGQSVATVGRSLTQLVKLGVVERQGRQRRMLRVVPIEQLSLTHDRKADELSLTSEQTFRSPVSNVTRSLEVDDQHARFARVHDERVDDMAQQQPEQLFEIDEPQPREEPVARAALAAFFEQYGSEHTISRNMIGRLGRAFKQAGETYPRELVIEAAVELGMKRVANPNAVESFVLRLQRRSAPQQSVENGWSQLASSAFERWHSESPAAHG